MNSRKKKSNQRFLETESHMFFVEGENNVLILGN
jgi:hypothetical protein